MGLLVEFDASTFGYPEEVYGQDELTGIEESVLVDYTEACEAFVETFLEIALDLVPVDTGYLRSTITAGTDGYSCYAEATAEYAQYVEYGTYKMPAQPYFEPALEAAMEVFHELAEEAKSYAEEELQEILNDLIITSMELAGWGGSFGSFLKGMGIFTLSAILLFPFLVNLYGILDSTLGIITGKSIGLALIPEIIIT